MELQAEITKIRDDTQKKVELATNALHKIQDKFQRYCHLQTSAYNGCSKK